MGGLAALSRLGGGCHSGGCHHHNDNQPIPILLGPMTGMLGHFGYSMHPMIPPQMAAMQGMMGHYGMGGGMGMPMMNHPMYGMPHMGHGYGFGHGMHGMMGGMGGIGMMNPMMMMGGMHGMMGMNPMMMGGMHGMHGMMNPMMGMMNPMMGGMCMGGMGMQNNMQQQQQPQQQQDNGGKNTEVVHVYADSADDTHSNQHQRRLLADDAASFDGIIGLKKCVLIDAVEICGTYYVQNGMVTLDYTTRESKILREDDGTEAVSFIENEFEVEVEYVDEESEEEDEFEELMEEHEEYALTRNERVFGFEIDTEIDDEYVDYINTVSWIWTKEGCNDVILSFMNLSICTVSASNDVVVYIEHHVNDSEEEKEVMHVRNVMDWDEAYHIDMSGENNANNHKFCRFTSMIKLCVELSDEQYVNGNIQQMQISAEFLY